MLLTSTKQWLEHLLLGNLLKDSENTNCLLDQSVLEMPAKFTVANI